MSDKNDQNGSQWAKTSALESAQRQLSFHNLQYDNNSDSTISQPSELYVGGGSGKISSHSDAIAFHNSARFQAPPLRNSSFSTHVQTPVLTSLGTTALPSNVPVPSGFVPPSYTPTAAATSVLTPNPFAVTQTGTDLSNHFGLQQFHQLNSRQKIDLNKFMSEMNTAAASMASTTPTSSNTGNTSGVTAIPFRTTNFNTQSLPQEHEPQALQQKQTQPTLITPLVGRPTLADMVPSSSNAGALTPVIVENVINAIGVSPNTSDSVVPIHGRLLAMGVKAPDDEKMLQIQSVVESSISEHGKQQISQILNNISTLKPVEKLMLYLRLPGDVPETDPLRYAQNPLGTRSEINHTINWVRTHLEHDPQVSIPKQDVYNDYLSYCDRLNIKPLSTADFGKVMKQVFPGIRPRRLGTRGHSRYCYAAMRKTTCLTPPQLPQITSKDMETDCKANVNSFETQEPNTIDSNSWEIIKIWAESLLNTKIENIKKLADHIKSLSHNDNTLCGGFTGQVKANSTHKKYAPREPKEKRLNISDMGPLKKRRKKKRKGSSSSESSLNQILPSQQPTTEQEINKTNNKNLSPKITSAGLGSSRIDPNEIDQKPFNMVTVKEEIIDIPPLKQLQHLTPPQLQTAEISGNVIHQLQPQQQQVLPMNLAAETRTVLTKAPPSRPTTDRAFGPLPMLRGPYSAAKNLIPKIIEISTTTTTGDQLPQVSAPHVSEQLIIKEEIVDEYNPSNILCKKVRKAQQTKGYWTNSPTSSNITIIVTPTTPTPPAASVTSIKTTTNSQQSVRTSIESPTIPIDEPNRNVQPISDIYLMGPPAQLTNHLSTSPSSVLEPTTNVPKVASRNTLQLRAKRIQLQQQLQQQQQQSSVDGSTDITVEKEADLPENLGLPRERVISICNMDKHELDDYFLPDEENSQDQESELLQYFQTGDAEEKLNSLDAAKPRNPTATQAPIKIAKSIPVQSLDIDTFTPIIQQCDNNAQTSDLNTKTAELNAVKCDPFTGVISTGNELEELEAYVITGNGFVPAETNILQSSAVTVGSASASLTLMSQKHQKQQQQQQIYKPNTINNNNNNNNNNSNTNSNNMNTSNKRKINLTTTSTPIGTVRKNCIFLPISPNINSTPVSSSSANHSSSNELFASPGAMRFRPKPSLHKHQSLDSDRGSVNNSGVISNISVNSCDPMIGSLRRRRSYISSINTSASAPPSPSVIRQQQQQQQQQITTSSSQQFLSNPQWQMSNANGNYNCPFLLNDQNSLDLDLFGATMNVNFGSNNLALDVNPIGNTFGSSTDNSNLTQSEVTQRSQSVPLSQLQRIRSPTFNRNRFQLNYSSVTSVDPTPIPPEFSVDNSTLLSENSCSQHSGSQHQITNSTLKLDDANILGPDSSDLISEADVNEILSSPDFGPKFSSIAQAITTTTCSSSGSTSGYSSGTCTSFGSVNTSAIMLGSGGGAGIVSRSVPSTPLPHHQQNVFGNYNVYGRRRIGGNDELHLSPIPAIGNTGAMTMTGFSSSGRYNSFGSRFGYDISKSMPTTPITTPETFRYSPMESNRDYLINGIPIDDISITSSFGAVGCGDNLNSTTGDSMDVGISVGNLNVDTLIDDGCVSSDAFNTGNATDAEVIMAEAELLGNL